MSVEAVADPSAREEALDRRLVGTLAVGHVATDLNQGAVPAMLPFFIAAHGLSYTAAAGLVLAATISSSVIQPLFGRVADRHPAPWLIPLGLLCAGTGLALAGLAPSYPLIFLAMALSGVGVAAFHPEAARMVNYVARGQRATGMSIFSVGGNAGFALGPLLTTPLLLHWGPSGAVLLLAPAAAVALLLATQLERLVAYAAREASGPAGRARAGGADAWGPFARLTGALVCRAIVSYGMNTFIPLYWIAVLHQSAAAGGLALGVMFIAGAVGTLLGGRLADRYGRRIVVLGGMGLLGPLLLALVAVDNPAVALLLLVPLALTSFAPFSVMVVMGQEYLPNRVGTASGVTLGLAVSIGGLAAPLLGWIADGHGLRVALVVLAVVPMIGTALALTLPSDTRSLARGAVASR